MKKNINKVSIFTCALAFLLIGACFTSCKKNTKLATPVVSYNDSVLSWDAIENADKYEVSYNGTIAITYQPSYTLPVTTNPIDYTVMVKAVSEKSPQNNSEFSEPLSFTTYRLSNINSIKSITYNSTRTTATILINHTWPFFDIYINDILTQKSSSNPVLISNTSLNDGINTISFRATANDDFICPSAPFLISIYKNYDYERVYFQDGELYGVIGETAIVHDTNSYPAGSSNALICNYETNNSYRYILASNGLPYSINKLSPPTILDFQITSNRAGTVWIEVLLAPSAVDFSKIEISSSSSYILYPFIHTEYTHTEDGILWSFQTAPDCHWLAHPDLLYLRVYNPNFVKSSWTLLYEE